MDAASDERQGGERQGGERPGGERPSGATEIDRRRIAEDVGAWLLASAAAFAAGVLSALLAAARYAGNDPYPNEVLLRVQWLTLVEVAFAVAIPAGILRVTVGDARRRRYSAIATVVAVIIMLALGAAFIDLGVPGPGEPADL